MTLYSAFVSDLLDKQPALLTGAAASATTQAIFQHFGPAVASGVGGDELLMSLLRGMPSRASCCSVDAAPARGTTPSWIAGAAANQTVPVFEAASRGESGGFARAQAARGVSPVSGVARMQSGDSLTLDTTLPSQVAFGASNYVSSIKCE